MRRSFQEVLIKMIKYRFLVPPDPSKNTFEPIKVRFRVIEARGLVSKEGRTRDAYCKIEFGDLSMTSKSKTKRVRIHMQISLLYRIFMKRMLLTDRWILFGIRHFLWR
jgi:hypothetical protein